MKRLSSVDFTTSYDLISRTLTRHYDRLFRGRNTRRGSRRPRSRQPQQDLHHIGLSPLRSRIGLEHEAHPLPLTASADRVQRNQQHQRAALLGKTMAKTCRLPAAKDSRAMSPTFV